jgi:twitching motility protein PilT
MVMTGRVHDMILDPKLTGQLPEVVAEGAYYGMQTFDQHLLKHLRAGRITFDEAMRAATSPHDFKLMVAAEGPLPDATPSAPEAPVGPSSPISVSTSPSPSPEPEYTATVSAPASEPAPPAPVPPSYSPPPSSHAPSGPPPSAPPPGMFS